MKLKSSLQLLGLHNVFWRQTEITSTATVSRKAARWHTFMRHLNTSLLSRVKDFYNLNSPFLSWVYPQNAPRGSVRLPLFLEDYICISKQPVHWYPITLDVFLKPSNRVASISMTPWTSTTSSCDSEGFVQTDSVIGPSIPSEPVRSKEGERGQSSLGSCRTQALSSPVWSRVLPWFSLCRFWSAPAGAVQFISEPNGQRLTQTFQHPE